MKVSVVVPTHNRSDRVVRAVDSALAQTHPPHEVIVVDDHSTDGTVGLVRSRYAGEPRVKVLACRHRIGAGGARNMGMAMAGGEWIAFLDSDDAWDDRKLAYQVAALLAAPGAVAAFATVKGIIDGKVAYALIPPADIGQSDLFFKNRLGTTSSLFVNRLALMEIGGFDRTLPSCQDWDLYLRLFDCGPIVAVPQAVVLFDDGDHPRISNAYGKVHAGHRTIFSRIHARIADPGLLGEVKASHALFYAELAFSKRGSYLKAGMYATVALVRCPSRVMCAKVAELGMAMVWDLKWRAAGRTAVG